MLDWTACRTVCTNYNKPLPLLLYEVAVDKWVLGGAEAPPNVWHLYLKDIAHSHSTELLIMCSES